MMGILAAATIADLFLIRLARIAPLSDIPRTVFAAALLCGLYFYTRWRKMHAIHAVLKPFIWMFLMQTALLPCLFAAARTPAPLVDNGLAHVDGLMHFSTGAVVNLVRRWPKLDAASEISYNLLLPLCLLATTVPVLRKHRGDADLFLLSVAISSILAMILFAFLPAGGPWTVYGYRPSEDQSGFQQFLMQLKSPAPYPALRTGAIITFPSFHVIMAVLAAAALWRFRGGRPYVAAITLLICAATVTTGWHYATDILGGIAVAAISRYIALRILRDEVSSRRQMADVLTGAVPSAAAVH